MNINDFLNEHKDDFFRYLVYRKPGLWTPYEQEQCFSDEDIYEDSSYNLCKITNYIIIGNDVLLEFDLYDFDYHEPIGRKEYRYLKDISLSLFEYDNEERELEDDMYE